MTVVRPSNEEVYLVALKRIANMDGHNISTTARAIAKQAIASAPETRPTRDVEHCDYPDCERHWTAVVAQARELLEPLAEHDPEIRKWLRTAGPLMSDTPNTQKASARQVGCEDANRLLRIHTETCDVCRTEKASEPLPCEHLRSERLGTKSSHDGEPLFEMRKCLDCMKIFRVRLAQNGE